MIHDIMWAAVLKMLKVVSEKDMLAIAADFKPIIQNTFHPILPWPSYLTISTRDHIFLTYKILVIV